MRAFADGKVQQIVAQDVLRIGIQIFLLQRRVQLVLSLQQWRQALLTRRAKHIQIDQTGFNQPDQVFPVDRLATEVPVRTSLSIAHQFLVRERRGDKCRLSRNRSGIEKVRIQVPELRGVLRRFKPFDNYQVCTSQLQFDFRRQRASERGVGLGFLPQILCLAKDRLARDDKRHNAPRLEVDNGSLKQRLMLIVPVR